MSATKKNTNDRNKHSKHNNNNNNAPDIDITNEEFSRISDALKNSEFRKLFLDYCEEIQDPENRKRYEAEIIQLESERGVDVQFLNPEPGFVIKTSVDGVIKCFVNVAKSPVVAQPTNESCLNPETGVRGLNWSLPLAQSPPRDDLDASGKRCRVYDVVFHPDALYLAERNEAFNKCLIDTALDAVEREYKVNLDRSNLKFPKLQFKGIARPTVIRKLSKNASPETAEPHPLDSIYPSKPLDDETAKPNVLPMKMTDETKPEFAMPKYIIKYSRDVDLSEYTDQLDAKLNMTVPHHLVVEIELPLLKSTSDDCQLDVTPTTLFFLSERHGAKYRLNLNLPYTIDDKRGSARFDIETRRMCITLPVVQENGTKQREMRDTILQLNREDSGVESDMRDDHSHSESPIEQLNGDVDADGNASAVVENSTNEPLSSTIQTSTTFLRNSVLYKFPSKFDCNVLDNVMSMVMHVRNVQSESITMLRNEKNIHIQFTTVGSGFYPSYYAFYLQLPDNVEFKIDSADAEAWENNIVLNINLGGTGELLQNYYAGIDKNGLKLYSVQDKFHVSPNSQQYKKTPYSAVLSVPVSSSTLDISVERSECERSIEIEIKPRTEQNSTCAGNTTEDDDAIVDNGSVGDSSLPTQKRIKKSKKKNKKRRSLSESAISNENQQQSLSFNVDVPPSSVMGQKHQHYHQQQQQQQQRKQRSLSECRDSVIGSSHSSKGILKRYSRYEPRPSISDSCSSIDECSSSYSCSIDAAVSSSLRFSKSFNGIPEEENAEDGLSESCKKTVRFNEVIMKQVFRLDSSILGQRKKNQKRRNRKQRAIQRRLSEGDSADYHENHTNEPIDLHHNEQYFKIKNRNNNSNDGRNTVKHFAQHDSGLDLTENTKTLKSSNHNNNNNKNKLNKIRARLESESSSDFDGAKGSTMMFEMDM